MKKKLLCKDCNEIATNWLSKEFFDMTKGNGVTGCNPKVFLKRLKKFVFDSTGNVNTALYIDNMITKYK